MAVHARQSKFSIKTAERPSLSNSEKKLYFIAKSNFRLFFYLQEFYPTNSTVIYLVAT